MANQTVDILIVEDNDDDYEATLRALDLKPHRELVVSRLDTATEAWDVLVSRTSEKERTVNQRPLFVILDLNMPGLDGRDLLARMKANDATKSIPVAILSTSDDLNDVDMCYRKGANAFIRKPVNWDEFVDRMSSLKSFWFRHAELPTLGS